MPPPALAPHADTAAPVAAPPPPSAAKAAFWDRIAPKYATDPIADMAGYRHTLQRVQAMLRPEHHVLELGCGTGITALQLAPLTRRYVATDVSSQMIAIAHARLAQQPTPALSFAVADAETHGFGQGLYDAVLAFNLLHLASDLELVLRVAAQALRPGGLLISKTPCIAEMNPLIGHVAVPLMRLAGQAPALKCLHEHQLQAAMAKQGLAVVISERHGTQRKDIRAFLVARKAD